MTKEEALRRDIGEVVGSYRIGGIPTVLAHASNAKLVNFHEQTHHIDVSTTLLGYGLKRMLSIEKQQAPKGLRKIWKRAHAMRCLERSWTTFEGHAAFNEYLYLYINEPEELKEWRNTLPIAYKAAFTEFYNLVFPHLQPHIHFLDNRFSRFQKLMFGQIVGNGVAAAVLDHAFAEQFHEISGWQEITSRLKNSSPDKFLARKNQNISDAIRSPIAELAKGLGKDFFGHSSTNNDLKLDLDFVGRAVKSAIWCDVCSGDRQYCLSGEHQLDLIEKTETELQGKYSGLKKMEVTRGGFLVEEVSSDLRNLPIDRSVKVESTTSEQELFDRITTGLLADDRFRVVLSVWSGFGDDAEQNILGVHDLRRIKKPIPTIRFEAPILYGLYQSPEFIQGLDNFFYGDESEISGKANLVWLGTYTGMDGKVGEMDYFLREYFVSLKGPKYIVVSQFSLKFFRDLSSILPEPPIYEVWALDQPPTRIDIAIARFPEYTVFWAGAGLLDKNLPKEGEIHSLGGIDFTMTDMHADQNLAAAIFSYTHCYSDLLAMKMFEDE